jgi:hypothetical protein
MAAVAASDAPRAPFRFSQLDGREGQARASRKLRLEQSEEGSSGA